MKVYLVFSRTYDAEHDLWDVFEGIAYTTKELAQEYCNEENTLNNNPNTQCFIEEVEVRDNI